MDAELRALGRQLHAYLPRHPWTYPARVRALAPRRVVPASDTRWRCAPDPHRVRILPDDTRHLPAPARPLLLAGLRRALAHLPPPPAPPAPLAAYAARHGLLGCCPPQPGALGLSDALACGLARLHAALCAAGRWALEVDGVRFDRWEDPARVRARLDPADPHATDTARALPRRYPELPWFAADRARHNYARYQRLAQALAAAEAALA